ncbi:hypothetical protein OIU34_37385 [Pararhizobium sp. BT-229]|nr:hypothetical protein [Pararhizobium sp. BT-229]MCV9967501.1 hypothetical protein [Pararhizobium sp. BT-229]
MRPYDDLSGQKPLRDCAADAANALHIGVNTFHDLFDEGSWCRPPAKVSS